MIILERNGEHVRLEVYANGGARCTVAAFELIPNGAPRPLQTDSINLNRAPERAKWAEALPAHLRAEAEAIGMALGVEVDRARAQAEQARRPGRSDAMLAPAEP